jgi:mono/diheme cytochrome c family protein
MKSTSKKAVKFLAIIAVAIALCNQVSAQDKPKGKAWPAPEAAVKVKNPVKSDDAAIKEGKELYGQQCKSCHGAKGKGDGTKAEKIDISCGDFSSAEFQKQTDGEIYWRTTEGRKPMPSFKEKLSDNERWAIVNYMRTLADKAK